MEEIDAFYFANKGKKIDRRLTLLWLQQELKRYQRESPEGSGLRARTG